MSGNLNLVIQEKKTSVNWHAEKIKFNIPLKTVVISVMKT